MSILFQKYLEYSIPARDIDVVVAHGFKCVSQTLPSLALPIM